jgi:hypothetical protein
VDEDIQPILERWPLEEGHNFRKIIGADGRERLQIRVCIDTYHGILQFDCDGRPDGQRPHNCPFALDYFIARQRHCAAAGGEFGLSEEDCEELFVESHQIYQRYVILLQVGDYPRTVRDTERNMELFRFVHAYARREQDRNRLERWWPYILRIHHTAKALQALDRQDYATAASEVDAARRRIGALAESDEETFQVERKRSLAALDDLAGQIDSQRPLSAVEKLEREKRAAIEAEDYRRAAELRDRINDLRERPPEGGEPPTPAEQAD